MSKIFNITKDPQLKSESISFIQLKSYSIKPITDTQQHNRVKQQFHLTTI